MASKIGSADEWQDEFLKYLTETEHGKKKIREISLEHENQEVRPQNKPLIQSSILCLKADGSHDRASDFRSLYVDSVDFSHACPLTLERLLVNPETTFEKCDEILVQAQKKILTDRSMVRTKGWKNL